MQQSIAGVGCSLQRGIALSQRYLSRRQLNGREADEYRACQAMQAGAREGKTTGHPDAA